LIRADPQSGAQQAWDIKSLFTPEAGPRLMKARARSRARLKRNLALELWRRQSRSRSSRGDRRQAQEVSSASSSRKHRSGPLRAGLAEKICLRNKLLDWLEKTPARYGESTDQAATRPPMGPGYRSTRQRRG